MKRAQSTLKNPDRVCTVCDKPYKAVAPLQKTCSKECRNIKNIRRNDSYGTKYTDRRDQYAKNRKKKNPDIWKDKNRKERMEIIEALGGECLACGHDNPLHLHIDYIPTMIGTGQRHPRHRRWMLDNLDKLRLLCANHHYELTTTGSIENTNIKQKRHND